VVMLSSIFGVKKMTNEMIIFIGCVFFAGFGLGGVCQQALTFYAIMRLLKQILILSETLNTNANTLRRLTEDAIKNE